MVKSGGKTLARPSEIGRSKEACQSSCTVCMEHPWLGLVGMQMLRKGFRDAASFRPFFVSISLEHA